MFYNLNNDIHLTPDGITQIGWLKVGNPFHISEPKHPHNLDILDLNEFILDSFELLDKGRGELCDFMKFSEGRIISRMLSKEMYGVLKEFRLPNHDWFPCIYTSKKSSLKIYGYGILRVREWLEYGNVNWSESVFIIVNSMKNDQFEYLDLIDFKHLLSLPYKNFKYKWPKIVPDKLFLNNSFNQDLFIPKTSKRWIISEKLKKRLEYEQFKGLVFEPIDFEIKIENK